MKFKRLLFFMLLASLSVLLSACGTPPATNWPGMATDGTVIYLASGSHVYSVQASTGTDVTTNVSGAIVPLRFPLEPDGKMSFYANPALASDGTLVIGSAAASGHALYAANTATSSIKWSIENKTSWLGGALILNDIIYAPAGDGSLYARKMDGTEYWTREFSEHALWTSPVSDGENIYLVTLDHKLYGIDPATGKDIWDAVEVDNGVIGAPAIVDGILYFGTLSGNFYAIDSANGSQVWVQKLIGSVWGTPGVDPESGTLYIGTVDGTKGNFYAIKRDSGETMLLKATTTEEGSIVGGPLVTADEVIFVTDLGRIQALDKTGAPTWWATFPKNKIYTTPMLVGELVVVAPMGSEFLMAAFVPGGTGEKQPRWTFTPSK